MLPHFGRHPLALAKMEVHGTLSVELEVLDLMPVAGKREVVRDPLR